MFEGPVPCPPAVVPMVARTRAWFRLCVRPDEESATQASVWVGRWAKKAI